MLRNTSAGATAILLLAAIPGLSDTKVMISYIADGQTAETTIYANGARVRYDYGKGMILLRQCDQKRMVQLDDQARTFLSLPMEQAGAEASSKAQVTDTGERKEIFGYAARHLKMTSTTEGKWSAPEILWPTVGHAEGETRLNAFDNALVAAGIGHWNLVKVTSIAPPGALVIHEVVPPEAAARVDDLQFERDELIRLVSENAAPPGYLSMTDASLLAEFGHGGSGALLALKPRGGVKSPTTP